MRTGRPSKYTQELADEICERIATTEHGLERICQDEAEHFPDPRTVYRWLATKPDFCQKYARAKEMQADVLVAQIIPISDDDFPDTVVRFREDGSEYRAVDHEHINRSRLRVDARKWLASKLAPKRYGDRVELAGDPEAPLQARVLVEFLK